MFLVIRFLCVNLCLFYIYIQLCFSQENIYSDPKLLISVTLDNKFILDLRDFDFQDRNISKCLIIRVDTIDSRVVEQMKDGKEVFIGNSFFFKDQIYNLEEIEYLNSFELRNAEIVSSLHNHSKEINSKNFCIRNSELAYILQSESLKKSLIEENPLFSHKIFLTDIVAKNKNGDEIRLNNIVIYLKY